MLVRHPKMPLFLGGCAAALSCLAAAAGLTDLDLYNQTTPPHFIPGTVSQDIGALIISLALLGLSPGILRGNDRLWLLWIGGLAYLAYGYAIFLFEAVLNPFYPLYLAIFSLSVWAIIAVFARLQPDALVVIAPPRRITAVLFFALAILFAGLWSAILIPAMQSAVRPDGLTINILDLTIVLPALILTGVMLLRKRQLANVLAVPLLIKAATIGLSVLLGTVISPLFGISIKVLDIAIYAFLGFGPVILVVLWMRAIATSGVADDK